MENMEIYRHLAATPEEAKKTIGAGRLKGFTDINPMYRIKRLTEMFGPCGIGWYVEIEKQWLEQTEGMTEVSAFCNLALYVKVDGEWSKPIYGTGGSKFVASEKMGLYMNDEAFKMAYTDALSCCCKMLGMCSDVYFAKDRTKYDLESDNQEKPEGKMTHATQRGPTINTEQAKALADLCIKYWGDGAQKRLQQITGCTSTREIQADIYDYVVESVKFAGEREAG